MKEIIKLSNKISDLMFDQKFETIGSDIWVAYQILINVHVQDLLSKIQIKEFKDKLKPNCESCHKYGKTCCQSKETIGEFLDKQVSPETKKLVEDFDKENK